MFVLPRDRTFVTRRDRDGGDNRGILEAISAGAPPSWRKQLNDALMMQLPVRGQVRSPDGLVHEIIGDHTHCDVQWAAYSRKEERSLSVVGWTVVDDAVTCLGCVTGTPVESSDIMF